jgi:hypothetical protein
MSENESPILIFEFQDLSNDILGDQFKAGYYLHFCPKDSKYFATSTST